MARDRDPIEARSYAILRSRVDLSELGPLSRMVTEKIIHVTADLDYSLDLVCDEDALERGAMALASGVVVVADTAVVAASIEGHPVVCKIGESLVARLARTAAITPCAAAIRLAYSEVGPGAVWAIGADPAALEEVIGRDVDPALVIGLPVSLVGAAQAKAALRVSGLPALSNVSDKGGATVAAAAVTALLEAAGRFDELIEDGR